MADNKPHGTFDRYLRARETVPAAQGSGQRKGTTMDRADQALYFAKQNGRNQIRAYADLVKQGLLKEQNIQTGEIELF